MTIHLTVMLFFYNCNYRSVSFCISGLLLIRNTNFSFSFAHTALTLFNSEKPQGGCMFPTQKKKKKPNCLNIGAVSLYSNIIHFI